MVTLNWVINVKNKFLIIGLIILAVIISIAIYFYYNNSKTNKNNYETEKVSTEKNNTSQNNITKNNNTETNTNNSNNTTNHNNSSTNQSVGITSNPVEEQIATFSTKIYSTDSARQNNINITCKTLNGTIVKPGETFSFCGTVGESTSAKGYQKADIFDKYGNKKKGLGGGNCQISTTLYNAVLSVPKLEVTERHKHSNYVPYIQKGKDAAVAYGSYDLKFKNNLENDIKILASSDGKTVTVSILSIK